MVKLILVRHGQSLWNLENKFTGWIDLSLSQKGIEEAQQAGKSLQNIPFTTAFTSNLIRAQMTLFEIMKQNSNTYGLLRVHPNDSSNYSHTQADLSHFTQLHISEELNERFYGDLQGLNKDEVKKEHGEEQVKLWRRSYDIAPPNGDSLKETKETVEPYLHNTILPELSKGNCLIAAHGNSLRAIVMELEKLTPEEISKIEIPTGRPIVYTLDEHHTIIKKEQL